MPSPRRLRLLMLASVVTVVVVIVYISRLSDSGANDGHAINDFYRKTMDGMTKGGSPGQAVPDKVPGPGTNDFAADTKDRLKSAEEKAKAKANVKALRPDPPSQIVGVGNSAEGQAKKPLAKQKPMTDPDATSPAAEQKAAVETETDEQHAAETEMNAILKKAPVIIFSKSYCPFSKRAKETLLRKYSIKPPPHVVELDDHKLGSLLQKQLEASTHRRTVPNIMINGVSIGGSDEVAKLDSDGELIARITHLGNKRVEMSLRAGDDPARLGL